MGSRPEITDWRAPDYTPIYAYRQELLQRVRAAAEKKDYRLRAGLEKHYSSGAQGFIDFIEDWFYIHEPQNAQINLPTKIPFILHPRQKEMIAWLWERFKTPEDGLIEKCREVGASWVSMAFAVCVWRWIPGATVGVGSNRMDSVDVLADPSTLLEKCRILIRSLPKEFLPSNFDPEVHLTKKRLTNPEYEESVITGDAGIQMFRGRRAAILFLDEAAELEDGGKEHEESVSEVSNCKILVSTVNGVGNWFHNTRFGGEVPFFVFKWEDDPRKDEEWLASRRRKYAHAPWVFRSQYLRDYGAELTDVIIPQRWVEASLEIEALVNEWPVYNLGIGGLDVGGSGLGKSVFIARFGPFVDPPVEWEEGNTTMVARESMIAAWKAGVMSVNFDCIGVGQGVESEIHAYEERDEDKLLAVPINVGKPASSRMWGDFQAREIFSNLRAEIWWEARERFRKTYELVKFLKGDKDGVEHPLDEVIVLPQGHPNLATQLSYPQSKPMAGGKLAVEAKGHMRTRRLPSPDEADALMLTFAEGHEAIIEVLELQGMY